MRMDRQSGGRPFPQLFIHSTHNRHSWRQGAFAAQTTLPERASDSGGSFANMFDVPAIMTRHTIIPSPIPSAPSFHFHLTRLKDTLFVWIGTGKPTSITLQSQRQDGSLVSGAAGIMPGEAALDERRVASDWAVAMPGGGVSLARFDLSTQGRFRGSSGRS